MNGSKTASYYNPNIYLYDNIGNQYPAWIQIGHEEEWSLQQRFVPGLPTNVNFVAEDVLTEATHITVEVYRALKNQWLL